MNKDEFLHQSGLRIKNSISDNRILSAVELFGYNTDKLRKGETILNQAIELNEMIRKEYGDVEQAFMLRDQKRDQAHTTYMQFVAIGRVALKNHTDAMSTLELNGRRVYTYGKWVAQVKSFYNNLEKNNAWMEVMATFGMNSEKLALGRQQLMDTEQFEEEIKKEKGDAQEVTERRDAKFDELAEWINDYEVIVKVALADSPQLMEKLGIVVK